MRQNLINFLLLFMFISPVFAVAPNLRVDAGYIEYSASSNVLIATNNVILNDGKIKMTSEHFYYNQEYKEIIVNGPFYITGKQLDIKGSDFRYKASENIGIANNIDGVIGKYKFKSENLHLSNKNIILQKALYTSCSEHPRHYHAVAENIKYYTLFGLMILTNVDFYVMEKKIFWLPYYVVGSDTYKVIAEQTAIPEVGYNNDDGLFIKERFGYVYDDHNTGTLDFEYKSKKGTRYGVSHQYIYSQNAINYMSVHYNSEYALSKAFELGYILENKWSLRSINNESNTETPADVINNLFSITRKKETQYRLSSKLEFARRKLISYEHVSFAPRFKIALNPVELKNSFFFSSNIEWARLIENRSGYDEMKSFKDRKEYNFYLNRPIYLKDGIGSLLTPSLRYSFIESINDFNKNVGSLAYTGKLGENINFNILYEHLFYQKGQRSFRYESFEIFDLDFLEIYFEQKLKPFDYNLRYKYATKDFDLLDSFVGVGYSLDCIRFGLGYRFLDSKGLSSVKLNEIKFSINIF